MIRYRWPGELRQRHSATVKQEGQEREMDEEASGRAPMREQVDGRR